MYVPTLTDRVEGAPALTRRRALGRSLARALADLDLQGLEHLPAQGAVVLAGNHRAALDGPLIFAFTPRPVTFLVKAEAFAGPVAPLLRGAGQVPVVRERVDRAPIRLSLELLRAGGVVGIFPEGTRGDGTARTARPGVGYLALRSGATVVPVACHGTAGLLPRRAVARPRALMVFGRGLEFPRMPDDRPLNRRTVAAATERIRRALAELVTETVPHDVRHTGTAA